METEIDREKLVSDNWPFALAYYRKCYGNDPVPYRRELLYDTMVDVFLRTVAAWDGRGRFRGFFVWCVHSQWDNLRSRQKWSNIHRMPISLQYYQQKYGTADTENSALSHVDRSSEQIDAEEFFERRSQRLTEGQKTLLQLHRQGLTQRAIGRKLHVKWKSIAHRTNMMIRKLQYSREVKS